MNNFTLQICDRDITALKASVCVSSVHRSKDMSKGKLASYMKTKAGQKVQDELKKASGGRELQHGEVVVTSPGNLASNFTKLMFVCLYCWMDGNEKTLIAAVKKCLENASALNYESIAFPAIGMGGQKYPPFQVSKGIVTGIIQFIQANPDTKLKTVYIALKDDDINAIRTFLQTFIAVLAGVEMGREMSSGDHINLGGTQSFKGMENTKPAVNNGSTIALLPRAQGCQSREVNLHSNGLTFSRQIGGIVNFSIQPHASLRNWNVGARIDVNIDVSKYIPDFVKNIVNFVV